MKTSFVSSKGSSWLASVGAACALILAASLPARAQNVSGLALNLDGGNGHVRFGDGVWFSNQFTIESWVYVRSNASWARLLDFGNGPGTNNVLCALSSVTNGRPVFQFTSANGNTISTLTAPAALSLNTWVHLAFTYDGATGRIYTNGVVAMSGAMGTPVNAVRTINYVGRSNWGNDPNANAILDEFRIWSVARTGPELQYGASRLLTGTEPGLLTWLRFEDGTGTNLVDATLRGNGATTVSNVTYTNLTATVLPPPPALGPFNPALSFDGIDDYVAASIPSALANNYTFSAWVLLRAGTSFAGQVAGVLSGVCGTTEEVMIHSVTTNNSDPQYLELGRCNSYVGTSSTLPVPLNQWTHVAITVSSNRQVSYFVNGAAAGVWDASALNTTLASSFHLGDNITRKFDGILDEVQIWNTAFSPAQIQANMLQRAAGTEAGLVGYWRFDEGFGTQAVNVTGRTGHATLNNGAAWSANGALALAPAMPALSFDGTNGAVDLGTNPALALGSNFTEEAWIFMPTNMDSAFHGLLGHSPGGNPQRAPSLWVTSRTALHGGFGTGSQWLNWTTTTNVLTLGAWNHVAAAYNGAAYQVYVNGQAVLTTNLIGTPIATPVRYIGRVENFFPGVMDEVRLWNTARTPAQIQSNMQQRVSGTEANLAGYWRMDEGAGAGVADQSGRGLAGTLSTGTTWTAQSAPLFAPVPPAPLGSALWLDGVNDFVRVDRPILPTNGDFTVECWMNATATNGAFREIISQGPSSQGPRFYLGIDPNGTIRAGDGWYPGTPLPAASWHHIALAKTGSTNAFLYIDGVLKAVKGSGFSNAYSAPFTDIGQQFENGGEFWLGGVDELRVWNVARTPSQIQSNMTALLTGRESGLVAYFRMDDPGATMADWTGRGNTGRLTNGAVRVASTAPLSPGSIFGRVTGNANSAVAEATLTAQAAPLTNSTSAAIADLSSTNREIFVPFNVTATNVRVAVNITHGRIGDLALSLLAPDGTLVRLRATNSETTANIVTSYPDQTASLDSMVALNGKFAAGMWRLTVSDQRSAGTGVLNSWSLSFGPAITTSDGAGFYTFTGLAAGAFTVTPFYPTLAFVPTQALAPAGSGAVNFGPHIVTVTNLNDNGPGSLRQTIANALTGDIINFATNLSGSVIPLTSGPIALARNITIDASMLPGSVTLSNSFPDNVLQVQSGATVALRRLIITGGRGAIHGGAINNGGSLALTECSLSNNVAGARGGGIHNEGGALTLNGCTIVGNIAGDGGGGVSSLGGSATVTVNSSTIAGNAATNASSGGGILHEGGTLSVNSTTITGNSALNASGGGIFRNAGSVAITNTIVAGNTASTSANISGPFTGSTTSNLVDVDAKLGPLGNYGGPTPTMPPMPGSPAINAGGVSAFVTDQRGFPRVVGASADIGAVEAQTLETFVTSVADSGTNSLRGVISNSAPGMVIYFAGSLSGQTITLTSGQLLLNKNLTIDASALGGLRLNGNTNSRIFEIAAGATNVLTALTLTNGYADGGGGILNNGTLTVNRCTIVSNITIGSGGGINSALGSALTVNDSTITGNSCVGANGWYGGAINLDRGTATLNHSTLVGNSCLIGGGGIWLWGTLTANHCTVVSNTVTGNYTAAWQGGGGIVAYNGALTLGSSIVAGNSAVSGPNLKVSGAVPTFTDNNVTNGNPLLVALGNYGGPTPTMPPLPGSPAIDSATNSTAAVDQRGLPRPSGARSDVGAVEAQAAQRVRVALNGVGTNVQITLSIPGSFTTNLLTDANGMLDATVPLDAYLPYVLTPSVPGLPGLVFSPPTLTNTAGGTVNFSVVSGSLAGRVTEGAVGLPNILVNVTGSGTNVTLPTDASGNYFFGVMKPGSYVISVVTPGLVFAPSSVAAPAGSSNVNFSLLGGTLAGRVTAGGSAVPGVTVHLLHFARSNANALVIPDTRSVTSSIVVPYSGTIGLVRVALDISHSFRGDLALTLISPSNTAIRLKVSDVNDDWYDVQTSYPDEETPVDDLALLNGANMAGTWKLKVDDQFAEDSGVLNTWSLMLGIAPTTTDSAGYYAFNGLPYDFYFVQPVRAETTFKPAFTNVVVGTTNANFEMDTTFLRGHVTAGTNGAAFPGVLVVLSGMSSATNVTDANGDYDFTGLVPGSYTLTPIVAGHFFSPSSITTNGGASNLNFSAVSFPISGRVVDTKTNGVPGVTLATAGGTATTDADGAYMLPNLAPATYTITPSALDTTFVPTNRVATISNRAVSRVDFLVTQSPPSITQITNVVVRRFGGTGAIRFDIGDRESPASALRVTVACSDATIFADTNIVLAGESWYRSIALTNTSGQPGVAVITLNVSDGALTTTRSFSVRVDSVPLVGIGSALQFNGSNSTLMVSTNVIGNKGDFTAEAWVNVPWSATNAPGARTLLAQAAPPPPGSSIEFNGSSQYISIVNFGTIAPTNEVTVEFWASANGNFLQSAFMLQPDRTTNRFQAHVSYNNGNTYWDFGNIGTTGRLVAANVPGAVSNWVHYALVASRTGNTMSLYTNGALSVTTTGMTAFVRGAYDLRLGGSGSFFFRGRLGDFRIWNVARTAAQIQSSFSHALAGTESGLLLYYRLNETNGTVALNSATATGPTYNGTLVNGPVWSPAPAAPTNTFFLGYDAQGRIRAGSAWTNTGVALPFGGWHHVALVKDNSNSFLYLDGVLKATRGSPLPLPPQLGRFDIGSQAGGTNEFWLGGIEEVRVWKTAMSQAEITNAMHQRFIGTEPGLLGLWHFDEATNVVAHDSSSRSNHAAISTAPWIQSGVVFDHYTVQEEAIITDYLPAYDPDGDPMSFRLVNLPIKGTLTLLDTNTGLFRYTAFTNVNGSDSFSFQANDGAEDSEIAFVVVTILADTNPPVIVAETNVVMAEDTVLGPLPVVVGDRETPASVLTLRAYSSDESIVPATNVFFGGISSNRLVTIRPATNAFATNVTILLVVDDGENLGTNVLSLTVTNVNDLPTITSMPDRLTPRSLSLTNTFTLADVDNHVASLSVTATSSNAALITTNNIVIAGSGAARAVSVTPAPGVSGMSLITLAVSDHSGGVTNTSFMVVVNDPPTVAAISPQTGFRNSGTSPVGFTVSDPDSAGSNITVTARSSDPKIVPNEGILVSGSGTNWSVSVKPVPGQYGVVTITLYVFDGLNTVTSSFQVEILSGPLFAIEDLGPMITPKLINDKSLVVGYGYAPNFEYFSYQDGLVTQLPRTPSGHTPLLNCLNNQGVAGGSYWDGNYNNLAVLYANGVYRNVTPGNETAARVRDLNDAGAYVLDVDYKVKYFFNGSNLVNLATALPTTFYAGALNNAGKIAGAVATNFGPEYPVIYDTASGQLRHLGAFGSFGSEAIAINNRDQILIWDWNGHAYLLTGSVTNQLSPGGSVNEFGIYLPIEGAGGLLNDLGQVVGAVESVDDANYRRFAYLWSDGVPYKLFDQMLDTNGWISLDEATGINNRGEIIGWGTRTDGSYGAFLLRPQWIIGQPISPPLAAFRPPGTTNGTFYGPSIELLSGGPQDTAANSFVWSALEAKLYPVRPVTARISWLTTSDLTDQSNHPPVTVVGSTAWPKNPQRHIVGAPVQLNPVDSGAGERFFAVSYPSDGNGVVVDSNSKGFNSDRAGYAVLRYLKAGNTAPNPEAHSNYFQVVRSYVWDDPAVLRPGLDTSVGQRVVEPPDSKVIWRGASQMFVGRSDGQEVETIPNVQATGDGLAVDSENGFLFYNHGGVLTRMRLDTAETRGIFSVPATEFYEGEIMDLFYLIETLRNPSDPLSDYLMNSVFSWPLTDYIAEYPYQSVPDSALEFELLHELTVIVRGDSLYESNRFLWVSLRPETQALLDQNPTGFDLKRLNRLLLEDAFWSLERTDHDSRISYILAADAASGRVFFTHDRAHASGVFADIKSCDVSGQDVRLFRAGGIYSFALDAIGQRIFWSEDVGMTPDDEPIIAIKAADVTGQGEFEVARLTNTFPPVIAVDGVRGNVFWNDLWENDVYAAGLNGTNARSIFQSPNVGYRINRVSADTVSGQVYFGSYDSGWRANADGSQLEATPWLAGNPRELAFYHPPPRPASAKSGWLVHSNSYYDGVGADRAYDRATQTGPIIPVNISSEADKNLAVVFYHPNAIGVDWADSPVLYDVHWPTNPPQIVIASGLGSGPLSPVLYPQKLIYNQPDRNLPGFNPNEEHALFAPGTTGEALFALRNDLNAVRNHSQPYALLKYRDPADGQWSMKVYQVVITNAEYPEFKFVGLAGNEIQPPYPLSLLPLCGSTIPVSGPYWRDRNNKIYARAGVTPEDPTAEIVVQYYYPLQVGFWYDLDPDGLADAPVGSCVPWLNRLSGQAGPPINTTYKIVWPGETPALQIGETLTTARFGLPGVRNFASAEVIFDSLNPDGSTPFDSKVRLYDPYSPRILKFSDYSLPQGAYRLGDGTQLPVGYVLPGSIKRDSNGGKDSFPDLPYHLRSRLKFDPINKWLSWEGLDVDTGVGDPLVLINVMTIQERERIKQLSTDGNFRKIIEALYDLTRNPNRLDINQDGVADRELLIGFTYEYTVRVTNSTSPLVIVTNVITTPPSAANMAVLSRRVVPERLSGVPKALTAGLPFDPPMPAPGMAANFNGVNSSITVNNPGGMTDDFTIEFWMRTTNTAGTEDPNWNSWTRGAGLVDASSSSGGSDFGVSLIGGRVYFGAGVGQYASGPLAAGDYSNFERFEDRFRINVIRLTAFLGTLGLLPEFTGLHPLDQYLFEQYSLPLHVALLVPESVGFPTPEWFPDPFYATQGLVNEALRSEVNSIFFPGNSTIYTSARFAGIHLWPETAGLLAKPSKSSEEWQRLNRLLMEDAYPYDVRHSRRETTTHGIPVADAHWFVADGIWHHVAAIRKGGSGTLTLMVDGVTVATGDGPSGILNAPTQLKFGQLLKGGNSYQGLLDEVRLWRTARTTNEIADNFNRKLTGSEPGLAGYWLFDETGAGLTTANTVPSEWRNPGVLTNVTRVAVTASQGANVSRYITIAENNDPNLSGLPVSLHVIRFGGGPALGDLRVIYPDNVFDERLTLRHSGDFGGAPENLAFEWWTHPDSAVFSPLDVPIVDTNGVVIDARGWVLYKAATPGQNFITIGEGGESSLFTLSDNWFLCRYRGYNVAGTTNWTRWIGDPASQSAPMAMLAPGWIKRVLEGINPFDQRVKDFHKSPIVTYSSMLMQAGSRWEGDVALNPDPAAVNSVGLIEMYTTVLNRGRSLSIDGTPAVDSDPANNALLLAASRIADLYMLIGNEAVADAVDPTVEITVFSPEFSPEFSSRSSSLFAFQNQLDSLLEEELTLYRGRDDSQAGVQGKPVYNRLIWNFTGGDGEVAYTHTYNLSDVNFDGVLNEFDAKTIFPQGHGDAWGHYLTAAKIYFDLLRQTNFTWVPRTEHVLVAGTSVEVDYLDERKFARIASARARAGREIVDLTYRKKYVEDPAGQYQGYKDTDTDRAWGVTEWARRAGQAAWFDWLTANTILPAKDANTNHTGIAKIDRTTVTELAEIASQHRAIQTVLDKADAGLNPVGVAKGAVPFDIDPSAMEEGVSHFDQVYDRAVMALHNTQRLWNDVNSLSRSLRRRQDATEEFTRNANDQERDFKNRLIEVFGYPYAGDIGPGGTYPSGYDGPDLYHYMYVGATEIGEATAPPSQSVVGYYAPFAQLASFYFPQDVAGINAGSIPGSNVLAVSYPLSSGDFAFVAPDSYGQRRAPGEIQLALSDLVQAQARLKQALNAYDNLVKDIRDSLDLLRAQYALNEANINILNWQRNSIGAMNGVILGLKATQLTLRRIASLVNATTDLTTDSLPKVLGLASDAMGPVRGTLKGVSIGLTEGLEIAADVAEGAEAGMEVGKEDIELQAGIQLQVASQNFEVLQRIKQLEALMREEPGRRLEAFTQAEIIRQTAGRYLAALAAGQRLVQERYVHRTYMAADVQEARYQDMAFRIFRNDALQKYRAQFDLSARYVYLAANAYDYEVNLLGSDPQAGQDFLTDIVRQRHIGVITDGEPVVGQPGLADALARLKANWDVLRTQFGVNNPQLEDARFSLRRELFRIKFDESGSTNADTANALSDAVWKAQLQKSVVPDLWQVPQFRRFCRPFAPELAGPQPGIIIRFPTTITYGLNFFGWPLSGGDSAYDPTLFSTRIGSAGVWFDIPNSGVISATPRVYLVPVGMDVMRSPTGDTLATREWRILDQVIPEPFPIGASTINQDDWIPINDSLGGNFVQIRRYSSFPALMDGSYSADDLSNDTRLIGRSAWNTEWMLIIPGGTLLSDPNSGINAFIDNVKDIKFYFQTYSYSGN